MNPKRPTLTASKSETSGITTPLVAFIDALPYCFVMRVNSGLIQLPGRAIHLAPTGTPDIHATIRGVSAWFETKCKGKKPSKEQLETHEQIRRAHGVVHVVDSLEQGKRLVMNIMRPGWQAKDAGELTVTLAEIESEFRKAVGCK